MKKIMIILLTVSALPAFAAKKGLYMDVSAAGGINPLAGRASASLFYRLPLSSDSSPLFNGTKTDLGITGSATPADYSGTGYVYFEPLAIFGLRLSGTYRRYYTAFGYGYKPVSGPDASYSSKAMSDIDDKSRTSFVFAAEPTLRLKYERLIAVNTITFTSTRVKNGDPYYYESYSDTIHEKNDKDYANSASLLFEVNSSFLAGVNDYYQKVSSTGYHSNRIASVFIYNGKDGENELTAVFMAGSYTENRNYKGKPFGLFYIGRSFMLE
jgi:hypothetical protein